MAEMMDLYNEAENSVLGTLIADAEVNASLVFTRVRPEDFVTGISRQIFETCRAMYGRGDVIDPLTVKAACGSEFATWLKELEQITPSARYCGAYVDKLLELSRRYRLQKLFREALDGNFAGLPMEELIGKIECMNNVVADDNDQRSSTMTDLLTDFYGRMGTERQYLDWGFDELNRYVKVNPRTMSWLALDRVQARPHLHCRWHCTWPRSTTSRFSHSRQTARRSRTASWRRRPVLTWHTSSPAIWMRPKQSHWSRLSANWPTGISTFTRQPAIQSMRFVP